MNRFSCNCVHAHVFMVNKFNHFVTSHYATEITQILAISGRQENQISIGNLQDDQYVAYCTQYHYINMFARARAHTHIHTYIYGSVLYIACLHVYAYSYMNCFLNFPTSLFVSNLFLYISTYPLFNVWRKEIKQVCLE